MITEIVAVCLLSPNITRMNCSIDRMNMNDRDMNNIILVFIKDSAPVVRAYSRQSNLDNTIMLNSFLSIMSFNQVELFSHIVLCTCYNHKGL